MMKDNFAIVVVCPDGRVKSYTFSSRFLPRTKFQEEFFRNEKIPPCLQSLYVRPRSFLDSEIFDLDQLYQIEVNLRLPSKEKEGPKRNPGGELFEPMDSDDIKIDLKNFSKPEELEDLGMEILKRELGNRGMKVGGTLQERAQRLFLMKDTNVVPEFAKKRKREDPQGENLSKRRKEEEKRKGGSSTVKKKQSETFERNERKETQSQLTPPPAKDNLQVAQKKFPPVKVKDPSPVQTTVPHLLRQIRNEFEHQ